MTTMTKEAAEAAGPGFVVLNIGGHIGAAVVTAPACLEGREVEIRAVDAPWDGRHVGFHMRLTADGPVTAAVFPQLAQGDWEVRLRYTEKSPVVPVRVVGGRASTVAFPE
jgi:hypothetical protein